MATKIVYRTSSTPTIPGSSSVKGTALTNLEIDANFKTVDDELVSVTALANSKSSLDDVVAMAIALG